MEVGIGCEIAFIRHFPKHFQKEPKSFHIVLISYNPFFEKYYLYFMNEETKARGNKENGKDLKFKWLVLSLLRKQLS
jgi:hypothetical protein